MIPQHNPSAFQTYSQFTPQSIIHPTSTFYPSNPPSKVKGDSHPPTHSSSPCQHLSPSQKLLNNTPQPVTLPAYACYLQNHHPPHMGHTSSCIPLFNLLPLVKGDPSFPTSHFQSPPFTPKGVKLIINPPSPLSLPPTMTPPPLR